MAKYQDQAKMIFRNFLNLFHQVFDGLSYLKTRQIVHRDIKCELISWYQLIFMCRISFQLLTFWYTRAVNVEVL